MLLVWGWADVSSLEGTKFKKKHTKITQKKVFTLKNAFCIQTQHLRQNFNTIETYRIYFFQIYFFQTTPWAWSGLKEASSFYRGNLNTGLVWYSNGLKLSNHQRVQYSYHHLNTRPVSKWCSEYRTTIWIPGIWILGIWIPNKFNTGHLNTGQVKVCYSDVQHSNPHCIGFTPEPG